MFRIYLPKRELQRLYKKEGLTTYQIAKRYGCCQGTIWNRLKEYGIKTRFPWNGTALTKAKLQHWYVLKKLSTWEIEKRYGYPRGTVHRKLKEFDILLRTSSEAHIRFPRKDFDGSIQDKAYLLGFTRGDLRIRRLGDTIHADCGSTKKTQVELIKELFIGYGHVWIGRPTREKKVQIEANLNLSFSFLLGKEIPKWVYNQQTFFAFFAGFSDAEGSIFIPADGRAVYSLGNYNRQILSDIRESLLRNGIICSNLHESKIKDRIEKDGYGHKQNYWMFQINRKESLLRLFDFLEPYVRHRDKKIAIQDAIANIVFRNVKYGYLRMNAPALL
ncbi:MAG: LAGLIDADG family homing endonuclease [Candidatus Wildermuthbacteria bacterium]|nr:LAGLIDADG family homing endonuclease [Candidatus Wildermuthbacteria bacterium]